MNLFSSEKNNVLRLSAHFLRLRYTEGAERGFGGDFICGSRPLSEDWVQVACSHKT